MNITKLQALVESGELIDITNDGRDKLFKNRVGFRYNKIVVEQLHKVVKHNQTGTVKVFWLCKCDCGNSCIKVNDSLNRKGLLGTCSHSCPLRNTRPRTPETYFDGCISSTRARYRNDATKRGYDFDLSKEEFKQLVLDPCFLCGKKETQYVSYRKTGSVFRFNGIDRLDNTEGYNVKNCLPCCKRCNTLKNGITPDMVKILYNLMVERGLIKNDK